MQPIDFLLLIVLFSLCEWKYLIVFLSVRKVRLSNYQLVQYIIYLINSNILLYTIFMYINTFLFIKSFHVLYKVNYTVNVITVICVLLYLFLKHKSELQKYKFIFIILLCFVFIARGMDLLTLLFVTIMVYFSIKLAKIRIDYLSLSLFIIIMVYDFITMNIFSVFCVFLLFCEYLIALFIERKLNNEQET